MAVQLRRLTPEEAAMAFPKRGQMDLTEYVDALRGLEPGDAAEIQLGGLTSRAMKRRVGQAAKQLGFALKWARDNSGNAMRFQVREASATKPRNGRRGRRKKIAE